MQDDTNLRQCEKLSLQTPFQALLTSLQADCKDTPRFCCTVANNESLS